MDGRPPNSRSDYLAAERTFLAWIRTGLALMGFGFVVARFGLFLETLQAGQPGLFQARAFGPSFWFGTALIILGVVVNVVSARNHYRLIRELSHGDSGSRGPSRLGMAIALILAVVGMAMAAYVALVHGPGGPHAGERQEKSMTSQPDHGIVTIPSRNSVDQTVAKLNVILGEKGIQVFTWIDHSGEAEKVGIHMPPTRLVIFGNPKAGTPLMLASPSVAIDLPLKILIAEDAEGKVWVSYNSPQYLAQRHQLPGDLLRNIAAVETVARLAAD